MKLIKPSYEILNENDLFRATKEIELAARTCYKSEDKIGDGTDLTLVKMLMERGHDAMLEFGPSISVKFICDRGVSHELVRHRLCSFAQESTRYCNYSKDKFDNQITFIIPSWINAGTMPKVIKVPSNDPIQIWLRSINRAEIDYNKLISLGWKPQQARSVLPNSLKTEIVIKANLREWRHIFFQRVSPKAHPQMRELIIPLLQHFQKFSPVLFDDIKAE